MRKIKKRSKKPDDADRPTPIASIIAKAIDSGQLDIMSLDMKNLPDSVINALKDHDDENKPNIQRYDAAIVIYDKYIATTQHRPITKKDIEAMLKVEFSIMIHATLEAAKRAGFIRSYKTDPHIFDPRALIGCDFGDNKFFQGAEAFRMLKETTHTSSTSIKDNQ